MSLKDTFYTVKSLLVEEGSVQACLILNAEHAIFKGHFPGNPVTPGVVQLEILGEVLSDVLDQKVSLKTMGNCKFLAILNPEVNIEIEVKITHSLTEENTYKVAAQFGAEGVTFTKIQAEFN
jgi:3-hydroxyacyl-[acyl-carrier-protein] dehydratase